MNSLEEKKRKSKDAVDGDFPAMRKKWKGFRGAKLSKDSRICILDSEAFHRSSYYLRAGLYLAAERILRAWSHYQTSLHRVKRFANDAACYAVNVISSRNATSH